MGRKLCVFEGSVKIGLESPRRNDSSNSNADIWNLKPATSFGFERCKGIPTLSDRSQPDLFHTSVNLLPILSVLYTANILVGYSS